jgi:membrane-associated phospholipid phosphatase
MHRLAEARRNKDVRWREALLWVSLTGALFFLAYGATNAYTASRDAVPSLFLPWERFVPFVDWMILPYMSIDLLFAAAFFLCRDREHLHRLGARIVFAILVSTICFLLVPLRFGFERPETTGLYGMLFDVLALDLPYNQFPSLHISLALIVWQVYRQRLGGAWRRLGALWFLAIGLSTVLVYQHHLIDVLGGLLVGLLALHLFPNTAPVRFRSHARATRAHRRIGARYLLAATPMLGLAVTSIPWTPLLIYPAVTLLLVAAAYLGANDDFLVKRGGRHCLVTRLLFAPYLLATRATWRWYRRRDAGWCAPAPGLLFGRSVTQAEAQRLTEQGVVAVLDLAPELSSPSWPAGVASRHLPVLDFTEMDAERLEQAIRFVRRHRSRGKVYVHCALGYLRSARVIQALLRSTGLPDPHARQLLRTIRPRSIVPDVDALDHGDDAVSVSPTQATPR